MYTYRKPKDAKEAINLESKAQAIVLAEEAQKIVEETKKTEPAKVEEVAKGGEKYHPPIAVDTGSGTILLDPKTMKPVAQYGKSVAGHVLETENGPMLVDTRTGMLQASHQVIQY